MDAAPLVIAVLLPMAVAAAGITASRAVRAWSDRDRYGALVPLGPPLERVAADLRRLNAERHRLAAPPSGPGRAVRFRAVDAAYREVLVSACHILEVEPPAVTGPGPAATAELGRVEAELADRGLDVGRLHRTS